MTTIFLERTATKERAILSIDDDWLLILQLYREGYRAKSPESNKVLAHYEERNRLMTAPTGRAN